MNDEEKLFELITCVRGLCGSLVRYLTVNCVAVQKRGYWLWDGKHHYCSVCSGTRYHDLVLGVDAAYCPYCGAKMDLEDAQ